MTEQRRADFARSRRAMLVAWGAPLALLAATNVLSGALALPAIIALISLSLAWMGAGCALNARRCGRRHCVYSAPIFLFGAVMTLLVGFGVAPMGRDGLVYVVWGTLGLVGLTFVTELIWGKYIVPRET